MTDEQTGPTEKPDARRAAWAALVRETHLSPLKCRRALERTGYDPAAAARLLRAEHPMPRFDGGGS